jgi:hypothetical protein
LLRVEFKAFSALPDRIGDEDGPLVVMPFIDPEQAKRSAAQLAKRAGEAGLLYAVYDDKRVGFITVANEVYRRSTADRIAYTAQDAFGGRDWLRRASAALAVKEGGLVAFNDGKWFGTLAAFGLVRRSWADGNYGGALFLGSYKRHYADVELTLIAMQQKCLRYDPNAVLMEVDWNKEEQATDREDRVLFHLRRRTKYDNKVFHNDLLRAFN